MIVLVLIGFLGGLVTGISPVHPPGAPGDLRRRCRRRARRDRRRGRWTGPPPVTRSRRDPSVPAGGRGRRPGGARSAESPAGGWPTACGRSGATVLRFAVVRVPAGSGRRRRRRPFAVVGGLVLSFAVFTLVGSWLLGALGLPQDLLRWLGLVVLGAGRPGAGRARRWATCWSAPSPGWPGGASHSDAGGFVLGLSLGLVFVPCAGPVLAAIAVVSANHRFGFSLDRAHRGLRPRHRGAPADLRRPRPAPGRADAR